MAALVLMRSPHNVLNESSARLAGDALSMEELGCTCRWLEGFKGFADAHFDATTQKPPCMSAGMLRSDLYVLIDVPGLNDEECADTMPAWEVGSICNDRIAAHISESVCRTNRLPRLRIG